MKTINLRWMYPHYRHDEFVDVTDEVWAAMYQAKREMENYERRKVYHRAYYSLDAYSWLENYALEHSRSLEDILLEREEMTTRLHLIAALPMALAHATPTQARRVHAYYIAGIKQPEISRREGVHSSKVAIHDKGTGNPHVHIMLTLRPLKENGQWGAKCRKAYDLDENGQRIPDGKGGWKNHREDTTDWNDKGNVEIWRVAWAAYTNRALESAGRPERIDHRSYKRQGIATLKYECVLVDPNDLNRKHIYIQVKKGDVDLNTDDYSSLNGEVYLLTTEGNVQNTQKYSNVKVADPTVIYEFAINPDKSHIIPENVLYWVKFLTEIENNRLKFSACKGIMFDTNISYSDTNESEMILGNKIAAYGDAKRYIDSFRKDDYALFYSKGRGIIAVGQIVTDTPTEVGDEKYHSVRMIVPENFNGDVKALPALSPNEIKTILKRNFYWASTIKTPFLTGVQVEMLIRELKKKHISAFGKYKIEY